MNNLVTTNPGYQPTGMEIHETRVERMREKARELETLIEWLNSLWDFSESDACSHTEDELNSVLALMRLALLPHKQSIVAFHRYQRADDRRKFGPPVRPAVIMGAILP